jgi:hypothetical protein
MTKAYKKLPREIAIPRIGGGGNRYNRHNLVDGFAVGPS